MEEKMIAKTTKQIIQGFWASEDTEKMNKLWLPVEKVKEVIKKHKDCPEFWNPTIEEIEEVRTISCIEFILNELEGLEKTEECSLGESVVGLESARCQKSCVNQTSSVSKQPKSI